MLALGVHAVASKEVPAGDSYLHCLSSLGSTCRITGNDTGMTDSVLWVGSVVWSALSSDIDP